MSQCDSIFGRLETHAISVRALGAWIQLLLCLGVCKGELPLASSRRRRLRVRVSGYGSLASFCATVRVNIEWRVEFCGRCLELVSQPTKGLALMSGL